MQLSLRLWGAFYQPSFFEPLLSTLWRSRTRAVADWSGSRSSDFRQRVRFRSLLADADSCWASDAACRPSHSLQQVRADVPRQVFHAGRSAYGTFWLWYYKLLSQVCVSDCWMLVLYTSEKHIYVSYCWLTEMVDLCCVFWRFQFSLDVFNIIGIAVVNIGYVRSWITP